MGLLHTFKQRLAKTTDAQCNTVRGRGLCNLNKHLSCGKVEHFNIGEIKHNTIGLAARKPLRKLTLQRTRNERRDALVEMHGIRKEEQRGSGLDDHDAVNGLGIALRVERLVDARVRHTTHEHRGWDCALADHKHRRDDRRGDQTLLNAEQESEEVANREEEQITALLLADHVWDCPDLNQRRHAEDDNACNRRAREVVEETGGIAHTKHEQTTERVGKMGLCTSGRRGNRATNRAGDGHAAEERSDKVGHAETDKLAVVGHLILVLGGELARNSHGLDPADKGNDECGRHGLRKEIEAHDWERRAREARGDGLEQSHTLGLEICGLGEDDGNDCADEHAREELEPPEARVLFQHLDREHDGQAQYGHAYIVPISVLVVRDEESCILPCCMPMEMELFLVHTNQRRHLARDHRGCNARHKALNDRLAHHVLHEPESREGKQEEHDCCCERDCMRKMAVFVGIACANRINHHRGHHTGQRHRTHRQMPRRPKERVHERWDHTCVQTVLRRNSRKKSIRNSLSAQQRRKCDSSKNISNKKRCLVVWQPVKDRHVSLDEAKRTWGNHRTDVSISTPFRHFVFHNKLTWSFRNNLRVLGHCCFAWGFLWISIDIKSKKKNQKKDNGNGSKKKPAKRSIQFKVSSSFSFRSKNQK
eukprot:comp21643_c0_seq1/m.47881 comp21643_c0_seq1/g.47881  ORF comp21643_c0_seq1/g.47881 comp21643_c0_seq1/m.47881 type:complete len:650 (-) comp21643_c0_seq1:20-1969(-)